MFERRLHDLSRVFSHHDLRASISSPYFFQYAGPTERTLRKLFSHSLKLMPGGRRAWRLFSARPRSNGKAGCTGIVGFCHAHSISMCRYKSGLWLLGRQVLYDAWLLTRPRSQLLCIVAAAKTILTSQQKCDDQHSNNNNG